MTHKQYPWKLFPTLEVFLFVLLIKGLLQLHICYFFSFLLLILATLFQMYVWLLLKALGFDPILWLDYVSEMQMWALSLVPTVYLILELEILNYENLNMK